MKRIPSTKPYFSPAQQEFVLDSVREILTSGRLILGPYTEQLECGMQEYIGTPYAVAVSSCTAALETVLRFADVTDREVIVPTNTFVASANAVLFAGGRPVLADIDPQSLCLALDSLQKQITPKTKAVIVVHIAGLVHPQIEEIQSLCKRYRLFLIEDVAHATGASSNGRKGGGFGDAGCFSFYPTKVMTTGTGGLITTPHKKLAEFARSLRHHGGGLGGLTDIQHLGNDWLMSELHAALGVAQLGELEDMIARRQQIAARYTAALAGMDEVEPLPDFSHCRHVFYKYPVLVRTARLKKKLESELRNAYGIDTGSVYFPPVHRQPFHARTLGVRPEEFPAAENVLNRILCLPIAPQMTEDEVRYVIDSLRQTLTASIDRQGSGLQAALQARTA